MKKRIFFVLALMCFCTLGLVGFQMYWNYQAYHNVTRSFKSDINDALKEAVSKESDYRRSELYKKYEGWLSDTNMIVIKAVLNPRYHQTQFTLQDRYPPYDGREPFIIGFDDMIEPLDSLTPKAKAFFIKRFVSGPLKRDLEKGFIYYYTQRLGDSLNYYFSKSKVSLAHLQTMYKKELEDKQIRVDFKLFIVNEPGKKHTDFVYATLPVETYGRLPAPAIQAWFPDPNAVFIGRMKWVLLSSLLLMAISLYCFYYTIHTLYHQKRLAALKNDFVNNMTHELKTPVATIGVAAEAITDFDLDKASTQEYAHIIREQSSNLTKLIEHILESAMEEETAEMPMEPICIKLLVEKALLHIKPQTEKRKAIIESSFIENVYVQGNWIHLTNVIVNLLDNSLKYSEEKPLITITSRKEQNWVILQISDKGIGIEACYQDRVFDRFFRVPTGNIHTVKGYGLGLSYAKAIVEKHRGSVILESKKLSGTSITLKLPVYMYENV